MKFHYVSQLVVQCDVMPERPVDACFRNHVNRWHKCGICIKVNALLVKRNSICWQEFVEKRNKDATLMKELDTRLTIVVNCCFYQNWINVVNYCIVI